MHDFVPEEMSHLHSGAGGVWKHTVEYKEIKMQEKIKVYLKTRVNCNILFADYHISTFTGRICEPLSFCLALSLRSFF